MTISTLLTKLPSSRLQKFFALCLFIIIVVNCLLLLPAIERILNLKLVIDQQVIGHKFAGLDKFINHADIVGYYTDMDLNNPDYGKLLAHAQYVLTPTIIDVNNLDHEYIIFVCSKESVAMKKIQEIGAEPLIGNQYGIILAKRKIL